MNDTGDLGPTAGSGTVLTPKKVPGVEGATSVVAGWSWSCATLVTNKLVCWGSNADGELGDGTLASRSTPAPVNDPLPVEAVAAGARHLCALHADGSVACWGNNHYGQLGQGSADEDPHTTPALVPNLTDVAEIALGGDTTCARHKDGTVSCWGSNTSGVIDPNAPDSQSTMPHPSPVLIPGVTGAEHIVMSVRFACALTTDARVLCWGTTWGTANTMLEVPPTVVPDLANATDIGLGNQHLCGVMANGVVRCFGRNDVGELGQGNTGSALGFVPVLGLEGVEHVSGSYDTTCATRANGQSLCWGQNTFGQTGSGSSAAIVASPLPLLL
jgi:alpha-tubulin suppressor-like RCC1 family protein